MSWAYAEFTGSNEHIQSQIISGINKLAGQDPYRAVFAKVAQSDQQDGTPRGAVFWFSAEMPVFNYLSYLHEYQCWNKSYTEGCEQVVKVLNGMDVRLALGATVNMTNAHDNAPSFSIFYPTAIDTPNANGELKIV